jgi:hypothetical protein
VTQKTRAELAADVTNNLADNTSGDITAEDVRTVLTDYSDSFLSIDDDEEVAATMIEGIADKAAHALAMGVPYFAAAPLVPSVGVINDQGQYESFTPVQSVVFPADSFLITNSEDPAEIDAVNKASFLALINVEDGADVTDATNVDAAGAVMNSDYDANTILAATADNTPVALTVAASRIVGRKATGDIAAMTAAETAAVLHAGNTGFIFSTAGVITTPVEAVASDVWTLSTTLNVVSTETIKLSLAPVALSVSSNNITVNGSLFINGTATISGTGTFSAPTNLDMQDRSVLVTASGGDRAISANATYKTRNFGSGVTIPSGKTGLFIIRYDGTDEWICFAGLED